jgi:hypothetical protein
LHDLLITYVAPAAIRLALSGATILYLAVVMSKPRLFGSALGHCIALAVVKLLNYVLP